MTYSGVKTNGKFCYSFIPARVVFVFLSFLGFCLVYAYKVVLSVTIVAMVGHNTTQTNVNISMDTCHEDDKSHEDSFIKGEFDWTESQKAMILGGFFYGYVITQIPGGILAERFGSKWIFGSSVLITAILSIAGPFAARLHFIAFFVCRLGQGLAEGVVFPSMNAMISRWMPKMERSRGTTIIFTGSQIGTVITLPLAGVLCDSTFLDGWPAIFHILGITGIIWFILWAVLVHETPETHPHISQKELDFIKKDQAGEVTTKRRPLPWKKVFTSRPVYALIVAHFGQNWGFLTILTLLPSYFTNVLHLDIKKNGAMSSLPYLVQAIVGWCASVVSDKVRQKQIVSVTVIRKVNTAIAYIGPAVCLSAVALSKCNTTLSIAFFILAMGFNGCVYPGFNSTHVDMAPDFAGTLMGLTNSFGNLPGFLAPLVAAWLYSDARGGQTLTNWSYVFYLSSVVFIFAAVVYLVFATAQLQPWGSTKGTGEPIKPDNDNLYPMKDTYNNNNNNYNNNQNANNNNAKTNNGLNY